MPVFEASYTRTSHRRSRTRSPTRPSILKRARSFSNFIPPSESTTQVGYAIPAPAPAPAPAWVRGTTRITYPAPEPGPLVYQAAPSQKWSIAATYGSSSSKVQGAYPSSPTSASYIFHDTKKAEMSLYRPASYSRPATPPNPLDDPDVKKELDYEKRMRMLAEQRHQETLKQQIIEAEITKAAVARQSAIDEERARERMNRLYMLSQQQQQQQMILHAAAYAADREHHRHARHRSRSTHRSRSRSRYSEVEEERARRRAHHVCSKCSRKGHYSIECTSYTVPHTHLLEGNPRMSAPALLPSSHRGRRSSRGSVYSCSGDEYEEYEEDEIWYSDGYEGEVEGVPADKGVLVMYTPGGGPGSTRSSVRHVVGL
ncbi:hypothetical protein BDZ91DRAFT_845248 [Kalaharituber pfeilii]|nr:hypothetical protein BDZ91DRAFT_845248 [Kalaharituber pfeilii]